MEKHEAGTARVVPIILHPCDWQSAPFGKLKALPHDGRPVSTFAIHHEALLQIATAIREAAAAPASSAASRQRDVSAPAVSQRRDRAERPRGTRSPVRIAKTFTQKDRDDFLEATFEFIATYFEESLSALERDHAEVETRFRRIDANAFTATVYMRGSVAAACKVRYSIDRGFAHGIAYSSDPGSDSSYNELLSLTDDRHSISLKPLGMAAYETGLDADRPMAEEEGAEYYWRLFIRALERA